MDIIFECGQNFQNLLDVKYHFAISVKRKIKNLTIDFQPEDFRHASGLHYIDDISIENNPSKTIDAIMSKKITDEILNKSSKYTIAIKDFGSVKERITEMRYLENYLDKSDFIRIYQMQDFGSLIDAEYFIEASNINRNSTVYIFLRKRIENDNYVMVSFFKKHSTYKGQATYWMEKLKEKGSIVTELYKHSNYNKRFSSEKKND